MYNNSNKKWVLISLVIFFLAFIPRYIIIKISEEFNKHTDLQLYINGGLLITNHINPYDFDDKKEVRKKLRLDSQLNEPWLMESEAKWNFYTSGNLPATLLYFAAIEYFAKSNPVTYRIIFAIIDSILSVLVFIFIIQFWNIKSYYLKIGSAILLGALNPVLLYWGGLIPEDKGMQIVLMIASLLFARHKKIGWSALFMGIAISFKGLGVFLLPLCLYYICSTPRSLKELWNQLNFLKILKYGVITTLTFGVFFVPFLPEVLVMMWTRLSSNLSGPPEHSSIWTIPFNLWPSNWMLIRTTFIIFFLSLVVYGSFKKRFDFEIVSTCLLIFFVDISLNMGSLDRMNMGFLVAILILGTASFSKETLLILSAYVVLGVIAFVVYSEKFYLPGHIEDFDAIFSMSFVLLLTLLLVHKLFNPRRLVTRLGLVSVIVCFLGLLWNVKQTATSAGVIRILSEVGIGAKSQADVTFTREQKRIAATLISTDPKNYNDLQKDVVFGIPESRKMTDIIFKVGLGKVDPDTLRLSAYQRKVIDSIISLKPEDYNSTQKSLIHEHILNFTADGLLYNVGMGKIDPDSILLTSSQREVIESIVSKTPNGFNELQKSLTIPKSKTFYAEKILRNVGMGKLNPDSVKLPASKWSVIDSMILAYPENYNDIQKKLLNRKAN
jgi:hypothetical protein